MTSSINFSVASPATDIDNSMPRPALSAEQLNTALPRPVRTVASVADTGRISFGAGYRLPTKK